MAEDGTITFVVPEEKLPTDGLFEYYDERIACAAQRGYCKETGRSLLAPDESTGYACPYCHQNIYKRVGRKMVFGQQHGFTFGISVETAATQRIRYCPFCYADFRH